jgi:hypothetical protein
MVRRELRMLYPKFSFAGMLSFLTIPADFISIIELA